jgi:NADPH-dependent curcumin reductase CurA
MSDKNRIIILANRPSGELQPDQFEIREESIPKCQDGRVLLKTTWVSVDPYMRNRMNNVESYIKPYETGQPLNGDLIAEVVESKSDQLKNGDLVSGHLPWQEYHSVSPEKLTVIDTSDGIPASAYLGVLGLTGLTAYFGLLDIGEPKKGETVVISGAAGAVGSIAGQIAGLKGCHVTGICGSEEKTAYLTEELHFDQAINYKSAPTIRKLLRKACPEKVDIYFDNVGGEISDAVFYWLNDYARIVLCGQIALYNLKRLSLGPRLYPQFIIHRVKMQGFIVYDYAAQFERARHALRTWIKDGKLKTQEHIIEGFENIPDALMGLFNGDNTGKQLVRI